MSIIIPTFKRHEKLVKCLESIQKSIFRNFEIIIINDAIGDDLSAISKKFAIKLIQHKKEKLWVKSRNEGAKAAMGKLLFFIDDDNVIYKTTLSLLVTKYIELQKNGKVGVLGPLMYNKDGTLWFWGSKTNWVNPYPKPVDKNELRQELIETDTVPNAYMVSRELFFKLGMEDPEFLHHEDTDFVQRARKAGYPSYIFTKTKIMHDHGGIIKHLSPFRVNIVIRSHIMLEKKFAPSTQYTLFWLLYMPINLMYYFLYKIPFKLGSNKISYYKEYINGLKKGLKWQKKLIK